MKIRELKKRQEARKKAYEEWRKLLAEGRYREAFSKAVVSGRLTTDMVNDAKVLLDLLGVPWVQAPSEGEAQAAYMALKGDVWATASQDYDSLLYGTPRLVRYVTLTGFEYLPSKRMVKKLVPELIELEVLLEHLSLTREQLIDVAILVGTDYNEGVKGIGPKKALKLIKKYKKIENLPYKILSEVCSNYDEIRKIFLNPEVTDDYIICLRKPDIDGLIEFLCDERGFSKRRVKVAIDRLNKATSMYRGKQLTLSF